MDQRILELLPWYANGTLSEAERAEVERYLAEDPRYRQELEFCNQLQSALKIAEAPIPTTLHANVIFARIEKKSRALVKPIVRDESFLSKARRAFNTLFANGFRLQLAGLAVIVLQTAVIGYMATQPSDPYSEIRSPTPDAQYVGPFIKMSFNPDAKEADIRLLLVGLGATIIRGPSQLGDYIVYAGVGRSQSTVEQLKQSTLVENAVVIAILPATRD